MSYPYRELTITSKVQECCGREFAAKLGEFDYCVALGRVEWALSAVNVLNDVKNAMLVTHG